MATFNGTPFDDTITGGIGADTMIGGLGNDTYMVDSSGDVIVETNPSVYERDTVLASVSYTLGNTYVENLTLTGTDAINGTGNSLGNFITGNSAANILDGGSGSNVLDGGIGADTMIGGANSDRFFVDNMGDVVIDTAISTGGVIYNDEVWSSISYTLGATIEQLTLTGTDAINGTGNDLDNVISGNSAGNVLNGGAGNDRFWSGSVPNAPTGSDTMIGGSGNDTYEVDDIGDVVIEDAYFTIQTFPLPVTEIDTVQSSVTYTLGANVENLTLVGMDAINGTGNELDNVLSGRYNSAVNVLAGGAGNDTYYIRGDAVVENAGEGVDTVYSEVSTTLSANVENLTLYGMGGMWGGSLALTGTGNALNNVLTVQAMGHFCFCSDPSNETLNGGAGADTMSAGAGSDTYIVDNVGDVVIEGGGDVHIMMYPYSTDIDTVQSSVTYTLGANVENLILTGTAAINGTGNELNNVIIGNSEANVLDGGAGADTMSGGMGYDTYIVDNIGDVVAENYSASPWTPTLSSGVDTVLSSITYTLGANVENLILIGMDAINGTGNEMDNSLAGYFNSAANVLAGGAGNDSYYISAGDTVVENGGEGVDTVTSDVSTILSANVENLTLNATNLSLSGTGNELNNVLTVQAGGYVPFPGPFLMFGDWPTGTNDTLDGGAGADTMSAGMGSDTYIVDNIGDVVIETDATPVFGLPVFFDSPFIYPATEVDTVLSSITYTLGANVENLTLTGTASINGTGNELNNVITGNSAVNMLDGGAGADTMIGGLGRDYFFVDNVGDVVIDTYSRQDEFGIVFSSVSYALGDNLQTLILTGTAAINGTANELGNAITGNDAANTLQGGAGRDNLRGGGGNDLVIGGSGDDFLWGEAGVDTMIGGAGNDIYTVDNIGDVVIEEAYPVIQIFPLPAVDIDTVQSSITYTLGADVENLNLTGTAAINGTGNELNNVIIGNSAANVLDGGAGPDTMKGGHGDDTYIVDNVGDVVVESSSSEFPLFWMPELSSGIDTVLSSITYTLGANVENLTLHTIDSGLSGTGNELNNVLTVYSYGSSSPYSFLVGTNDTLDGGAGADTMSAGIGDDTYIVDNIGDVIIENALPLSTFPFPMFPTLNNDTVQSSITYTLGADIENLILTGTDAINGTGNELNNNLTGNDAVNILDGGAGADIMVGGLGRDYFVVDNIGDIVIDTYSRQDEFGSVWSSISYALGENLQTLILTGTAAINGTGNELNNAINGNDAANVLNGGLGADVMRGGLGRDTYVVDDIGDVVMEDYTPPHTEIDEVQSSITYTLGANVEGLTLTGTAAINGTGNELHNWLTGNAAANILEGGSGDDQMFGGAGADVLIGGSGIDYLLGEAGADVMIGGDGGDGYWVDDIGDVVVETSTLASERDWVSSSISYTLSANVEELNLSGGAAINGTGNASNNWMTGNDAANVLDGKAGADTLRGGRGDDTYVVDNVGDVVVENAADLPYFWIPELPNPWLPVSDIDTVQSSITYTLGANVENLTMIGAAAINGTGNELNNVLTGNKGNNILNGGAGADTMIGGLGRDYFVVDNIGDVVIDTYSRQDEFGSVWSSISYTLGANLSTLILTGTAAINGTGNELNNAINGNVAANTLDGGAGSDNLRSGGGNDLLIGGTGNDYLWGEAGADTMIGGEGNDTYTVDNIGDVVIEDAYPVIQIFPYPNVGIDTVQSSITYTLGANVEKLTLTGISTINGTGNTLDNVIVGNGAANMLAGGAGNDTLNGGAGRDTIIGGAGADTIVLGEWTQATDRVVINVGNSLVTGIDKISGFSATALMNDQLDFASTAIAANGASNGIDVVNILSHSIGGGMISFDDLDAYTAPMIINAGNLAGVNNYLAANIASGENVAFYVDANSNGVYTDAADFLRVFQGGATAAGTLSTDDIFVDIYTTSGLGGVTALSLAAAANTVQIV